MDDVRYEFNVTFGSVKISEPTGRYQRGSDGYWHDVMTDYIEYDQNGVEVLREPGGLGLVGWMFDDPAPAKPWWKFW